MQNQLYPLVVGAYIESVFGHWPQDRKDGIRTAFIGELGEAEAKYAKCSKLLDPDNPLAEDALLSKCTGMVCEKLGVTKNEITTYKYTYFKVMRLSYDSFKELNLPETLRAVGKEL